VSVIAGQVRAGAQREGTDEAHKALEELLVPMRELDKANQVGLLLLALAAGLDDGGGSLGADGRRQERAPVTDRRVVGFIDRVSGVRWVVRSRWVRSTGEWVRRLGRVPCARRRLRRVEG
jgi:hypothetical protein